METAEVEVVLVVDATVVVGLTPTEVVVPPMGKAEPRTVVIHADALPDKKNEKKHRKL